MYPWKVPNFKILIFLENKESDVCCESKCSKKIIKKYINEGVHAYHFLLEIVVDQAKLVGEKSLCFNADPQPGIFWGRGGFLE